MYLRLFEAFDDDLCGAGVDMGSICARHRVRVRVRVRVIHVFTN